MPIADPLAKAELIRRVGRGELVGRALEDMGYNLRSAHNWRLKDRVFGEALAEARRNGRKIRNEATVERWFELIAEGMTVKAAISAVKRSAGWYTYTILNHPVYRARYRALRPVNAKARFPERFRELLEWFEAGACLKHAAREAGFTPTTVAKMLAEGGRNSARIREAMARGGVTFTPAPEPIALDVVTRARRAARAGASVRSLAKAEGVQPSTMRRAVLGIGARYNCMIGGEPPVRRKSEK